MIINMCTKTQKEGNCSSHNYFKICTCIYKIVLLIAGLNIVIAVSGETPMCFR